MDVYVINLDRDTERLGWMARQLDECGFSWRRFTALTPETAPERLLARIPPSVRERLRPGEIGIVASVLAVAERFLETGAAHCLVLEDDVSVDLDPETLEQITAAAPCADMIKLNDWPKSPTLLVAEIRRCSVVRYLRTPLGNGSFLLSRQGARRLLDPAIDVSEPVDRWIRSWSYAHFDVLGVVPPLIPQDRFGTSSIDPSNERGTSRRTAPRPAFSERIRTALLRARGLVVTVGAVAAVRMVLLNVLMRLRHVKRDTAERYRISI